MTQNNSNPFQLWINSVMENFDKSQNQFKKAQEVLSSPLDTQIANTPYDIVYEEDRVRLKHYKPNTEKKVQTPLLIVYALINRETMLDLQPGRSVLENLLNEGVEVYMIDWGYPTRKDRFLDTDDHVNGYINNAVDHVLKENNASQLNLMGICMGGTLTTMYASLYPKKVKNLITTVTPTNFDTEEGLLHVWAKDFDVDRIVRNHGNMPGDLLNLTFLIINPARLIIDKYVNFMENVENKTFVENFLRMEKWIFDSPDVPGEIFREFIDCMYKENQLIQNKFELNGQLVDLNNITMPLLNIYANYDHLVPPDAAKHLPEAVASKDTQNYCLETGHIGIYVSSKSQKEFAPKIVEWLKERDLPEEKKKKDESSSKSRQKGTKAKTLNEKYNKQTLTAKSR